MTHQSISLNIPLSFFVPEIIHETSPEDYAFILELGCKGFQSIKNHGEKKLHNVLFDSLEAQAKEAYTKKETVLQKELDQIKKTSKQELDTIQGQLATLKEHLSTESKLRLELENKIREEERRNREEIIKEKDERIQSLQAMLVINKDQDTHLQQSIKSVETIVRASNRELETNFHQLRDQFMKVTTGSALKGASAEKIFTELLQRSFGSTSIYEEFSLNNLGSTDSHSGDIHMTWRGSKILWEVKNYSKTVDSKEVQKFHQDMSTNTDMAIGIIVSMNTGIQGHTKAGDIDLQPLPDGRICIYLNNFEKHGDGQQYLQSLQPFLEVFCKNSKNPSKEMEESHELERYKKTVNIILLMIKSHQAKMSDLKNTFSSAKKKQDQLWTELQVKLKEVDNSTKQMLKMLLEQEDEEKEEVNDSEYLIFKPFQWDILSEVEKKFVQTIRKQFKIVEDAKMVAAEVRDTFKAAGISEEAIGKCREVLLTDDVWKKGAKDVKHLQKII